MCLHSKQKQLCHTLIFFMGNKIMIIYNCSSEITEKLIASFLGYQEHRGVWYKDADVQGCQDR